MWPPRAARTRTGLPEFDDCRHVEQDLTHSPSMHVNRRKYVIIVHANDMFMHVCRLALPYVAYIDACMHRSNYYPYTPLPPKRFLCSSSEESLGPIQASYSLGAIGEFPKVGDPNIVP